MSDLIDERVVRVDVDTCALAAELRSIRAAKKALEDREAELVSVITETVGADESALIVTPTGQLLGSYAVIPTSRFDSKRFRNEHPDLHAQYLREGETRKLVIK